MGDLTEHFSEHEFECKHCGERNIQDGVVEIAESVRVFFGRAVTVSSGYRCMEWNCTPCEDGGPGSNEHSQHPLGTAADLYVEGVAPSIAYAYLDETYGSAIGLGLYDWGVHVDTRGYRARW